MPELRNGYASVSSVRLEFDTPGRTTDIMSGPFRGYPRHIRNGLPEPRYRYRGTGHCMSEAEVAYWLKEFASCLS